MSWLRKFYDGSDSKTGAAWSEIIGINYTSGYWALNQDEESYGPYEKDIAESIAIFVSEDMTSIPWPVSYAIPNLSYYAREFDIPGGPTSVSYQRCRTLVLPVGLPELDDHGFLHSAGSEIDGYDTSTLPHNYKSQFRAGFQQRIYNYGANDNYLGSQSDLSSPARKLKFNTGGLPDEMAQAIEFYKNGYSEAQFITFFSTYYAAGARHENDDGTSTYVCVPYANYQARLNVGEGDKLLFDVSGNSFIDPTAILPTPTSAHVATKTLPTYSQIKANSAELGDNIANQFHIRYYTYPSSYPNYVSDLKSRFKVHDVIIEQSKAYIDDKVSILRDMLDSLLIMPKEFRVRMQASKPYDLSNMSSIPDGESMNMATSPVGPAASTTGMGSTSMGGGTTGAGSGGGSY